MQENVNSKTGAGMEMMPFYNIFNEWYAAQTSQKIRQVWKTKSEHGERVSSTVPYGYKKSETDKKEWVIDEPAAAIVKRIYALCLNGRGPTQIARQLEDEKVLVPCAYYDSIGKRHSAKPPPNIYRWDQRTVVVILGNRQYTGCTVNFKSTPVSYKDGRGTCKIHYIRNVVLEKIVLEAISDFVDFVRCYEPVFLYMLAKKKFGQ